MNDGGAQAVDVCLGVMSSTQNQLWTHIHLNERRITQHELDIMLERIKAGQGMRVLPLFLGFCIKK